MNHQVVKWRRAVYLGLALALAGFVRDARGAVPEEGEAADKALAAAVRLSLGTDVTTALSAAKAVDVLRLNPFLRDGEPEKPRTAGYAIERSVRIGNPAALAKLQRVFSEASTYGNLGVERGGTGCGFAPAIALRFWRSASREGAYLDALICFYCDQMQFVLSGAPQKHLRLFYLADDVFFPLLRFAAEVFGDDEELAEALLTSQEENARQMLFASAFPANLQNRMAYHEIGSLGPAFTTSEEFVTRAAADLRASLGPSMLLETVARAVVLRQEPWSRGSPHDIHIRAIKDLSAEEVAAGLTRLLKDQTALAGVAELMFAGALTSSNFPEKTRADVEPRLIEAAIIAAPHAPGRALAKRLTSISNGRPVLYRLAKGEIPEAPRSRMRDTDAASVRAYAILALVDIDPNQARNLAHDWNPALPSDRAARWTALFRLGEGPAPDSDFLKVDSFDIRMLSDSAIAERPTLALLDQLMALLSQKTRRDAVERVEELMTKVAGYVVDDKDPHRHWATVRQERLQSWWALHRQTWKPPTPPPPPTLPLSSPPGKP